MKRLLLPLLIAGTLSPHAPAQITDWDPGSSYTTKSPDEGAQKGVKLTDIKSDLQRRYGGQMLDARRINENAYEIVWETGRGERIVLTVDAKTGRVLSQRDAR